MFVKSITLLGIFLSGLALASPVKETPQSKKIRNQLRAWLDQPKDERNLAKLDSMFNLDALARICEREVAENVTEDQQWTPQLRKRFRRALRVVLYRDSIARLSHEGKTYDPLSPEHTQFVIDPRTAKATELVVAGKMPIGLQIGRQIAAFVNKGHTLADAIERIEGKANKKL